MWSGDCNGDGWMAWLQLAVGIGLHWLTVVTSGKVLYVGIAKC